MNGRKRERMVEIRRRKRSYKAQAEVVRGASWEVGRGHRVAKDGVDSKTRRSGGPLLEPCF